MARQNGVNVLDYASGYVKPLKDLCHNFFSETPVRALCYVRVYRDGQMLYLSTEQAWLDLYNVQQFQNVLPHLKTYLGGGKKRYSYWSGFEADDVYEAAKQANLCYGFNIHKNDTQYYETFIFSADRDNPEAVNFYPNHLTYLKQLVQTVKTNVLKEIKLHDDMLLQLDAPCLDIINQLNQETPYENFQDEITGCSIYEQSYITKRELECLYWTCLGKSADEVAIILNISRRTVEAHFENLKSKLDCVNKTQVIHKVYLQFPQFRELF